jgi:hypothetical protein
VLVPAITNGYVSPAHTNTAGHDYWLYYDGVSIQWGTDTFPGFDKLLIAFVHYGATDKFGCREPHGCAYPWPSHQEDHRKIGTYRQSGGSLSGYVLASTTAADRRPAVSACVIYDEDIPTTNGALAAGTYSQLYLTTSGITTSALGASDIIPLSGSNPYYNQFSSPNWVQTLMPANSVASVWLIAIPVASDATSQAYRFVWLQPQWITQAQNSSSGALATALANELQTTTASLNFGDLFASVPEYIAIERIVVQYTGGNWTIVNVSDLTGSRTNVVQSPGGIWLSSVTTDSTLTGSGTPASPLGVSSTIATDYGIAKIHQLSTDPDITIDANSQRIVYGQSIIEGNEVIYGQEIIYGNPEVPVDLTDLSISLGADGITHNYKYINVSTKSFTCTINILTNGIDGSSAGVPVISTFYDIYVARKLSDGVVHGTVFQRGNVVNFPNGYGAPKYIGTCVTRSDASYLIPMRWNGRHAEYVMDNSIITSWLVIASGNVGTTAGVFASIAGLAPTDAARYHVVGYAPSGYITDVFTNTLVGSRIGRAFGALSVNGWEAFWVNNNDSGIYWGSNNSGCWVAILGWEDNDVIL